VPVTTTSGEPSDGTIPRIVAEHPRSFGRGDTVYDPWHYVPVLADRLAALCPQLVTAKAIGSGHFLSLEVPEQINPMIDRFISLYVRKPQ
jgi:pimeloyl-ACP methyl ester carboxylesterase